MMENVQEETRHGIIKITVSLRLQRGAQYNPQAKKPTREREVVKDCVTGMVGCKANQPTYLAIKAVYVAHLSLTLLCDKSSLPFKECLFSHVLHSAQNPLLPDWQNVLNRRGCSSASIYLFSPFLDGPVPTGIQCAFHSPLPCVCL